MTVTCPYCGTSQPPGAACARCGAVLPRDEAAPTTFLPSVQDAPPAPPREPTAALSHPVLPPPPPPVPPRPGRRGPVIAAAIIAAVAVAVAVTVVLLRGNRSTAVPGETAPPTGTAAALTTGPAAPAAESDPTVAPPTTGGTTTTADESTVPSTSTSAPDPLGGPHEDIPCTDGSFFVQLASSADEDGFRAVVEEIRAAGLLPAGTQYARSADSCRGLFADDRNYYVLWAGPFPSAAQACPTRLAGPYDALVKTMVPTRGVQTCLCSADLDQVPAITAVGQQGVWVGELERLLRNGFGYPIGDVKVPGSYTEGAAEAVRAFQRDQGAAASGVVDRATWELARTKACG